MKSKDIIDALENCLSDDQIAEIKEHVNNYFGGNYTTYIADLIVADYYNRRLREEPAEEDQ